MVPLPFAITWTGLVRSLFKWLSCANTLRATGNIDVITKWATEVGVIVFGNGRVCHSPASSTRKGWFDNIWPVVFSNQMVLVMFPESMQALWCYIRTFALLKHCCKGHNRNWTYIYQNLTSVVWITNIKLLKVAKLNFGIRVLYLLIASFLATHAVSQDMSGWYSSLHWCLPMRLNTCAPRH